jgi:hypothetical protein
MSDPRTIFLAPYCEGSDDRMWCEDDMQGDWCHCDECVDKPSVRYVRGDIADDLYAALMLMLELADDPNNYALYIDHFSEAHNALARARGEPRD